MNTRTHELMVCAAAAAAGAALMYLLDPHQGARRRALLRDRAMAGKNNLQDYAEAQATRVVDRARGVAAEVKAKVSQDASAMDDQQIGERIRSELGRLVSHPGAIEVTVLNGRAALSGDILVSEREPLLTALRNMPEVSGVDDMLTAHESAENIPALQGRTE